MARPKIKGLLYFPFDIDFFEDNKIRIVKARYRSDGVMIYLFLLCEIYRQGYYIKADEDFLYIISDELGIDQNKVKQVLNFLLNKSLFDNTLFSSDKANMNKQMKQLLEESEPETIIAIHNHPGSSVPSLADLMTCVKRGYNFGLVACHDGKVYKYWVDKNKFNSVNAGFALDRMETQGYDKEVRTWLEQAGVYLEVW